MKTKNNIYVFCFAVCLSLLSIPASAATADGSIVGAVQAALETAAKSQILPQAIMWLGSFMGIQLLITNIGLLKSGADIEAVFAKLLGSLLWFGFVVYVMNNGADFIDSVGTSVINKFMPTWLSPGYILAIVTTIAAALITGIGLTGIMAAGFGSPMLALVLIVIMFVIVGVGLYVSIKIFMLKLELGLILVLAPLSFSLLGLNALKDQGIAPFKALISLIYRIVLFGIVCTAFKEVGTVTTAALDAIDWGNIGGWVDAIKVVFSAMFAFPMLGYLVYKSDSIASSLAGGSTNMGPGDVASAAAAGAAAGAMMGAGAAAVGAGNPVQSMSKFMQGLRGGSGSVLNASSTGAGGASSSLPLSPTPVASMGSGGGGGAGAKSATPAFKTNKAGAPMQPDQNTKIVGASNSVGGGGVGSSGNAGPSVAASGTDGGNSAAMDGARAGALSAGSSNTAAEAGAVAAGNGGDAKAIGDAVLQAGGNQSQAAAAVKSASDAGAKYIQSQGAGGGSRPGADTSLQSPPTGSGSSAVGGGGNPAAAGKAAAAETAAGAGAIKSGGGGSMGAGNTPANVDFASALEGNSGGAGSPSTPPNAAKPPSTGGDSPAASSSPSPGAADTSLQSPPAGSGLTAGAGGASSATDQKFDKLMDQLAKQQGGGKKTFGDHLSGVNQHLAQEKAATHVSINTHHSD